MNQIGLFTTELILSVEGDVPGLLKACAEDPVQAAQIFMQVWVLHASVRTPTGQNYDATLEVQPLPPASQQGNSLKFKTVSVKTTPVAEPAPAPKPQIGSQPPTASTPAPAPKLEVVPGGGQASGTPKGMLRDVDRPGRGVDVPASHPVLKGNVPANDPPPEPQGQRMKVAANAPKDVPAGQVVETAPPASIGQRRDQPAQATTKKPPPGGGSGCRRPPRARRARRRPRSSILVRVRLRVAASANRTWSARRARCRSKTPRGSTAACRTLRTSASSSSGSRMATMANTRTSSRTTRLPTVCSRSGTRLSPAPDN